MSTLRRVYSLTLIAVFLMLSYSMTPAANAAAPEVVMVYASVLEVHATAEEETTAETLNQLAKEYASQLLTNLNDRLPKEIDHQLEVQIFTEAYSDSLIKELETRLPAEIENLTTALLP